MRYILPLRPEKRERILTAPRPAGEIVSLKLRTIRRGSVPLAPEEVMHGDLLIISEKVLKSLLSEKELQRWFASSEEDIFREDKETWFVEVEVKAPGVPYEEERRQRVLEARNFLRRFIGFYGEVPAERLFWEALYTAGIELFDPEVWWVETIEGNQRKFLFGSHPFNDQEAMETFPEALRWYQEGQKVELSPGLAYLRWGSELEWGVTWGIGDKYFSLAGKGEAPDELLVTAFYDVALEAYTIYRERAKQAPEKTEEAEPPERPVDFLAYLLGDLRREVTQLLRQTYSLIGIPLEYLLKSVIEEEAPAKRDLFVLYATVYDPARGGFVFLFDPEQEKDLRKRLTEEEFRRLTEHLFGVEDPEEGRSSRGLTYLLKKVRTIFFHPGWPEDLFRRTTYLRYDEDVAAIERKAFGHEGQASWVMGIPVEQEGEVRMCIFVVGLPEWPVLSPEVQAAIRKIILERWNDLIWTLELRERAQEFGRYQFTRNLSRFLGHNLPKVTVNPLALIETKLRQALPPEHRSLAEQIAHLRRTWEVYLHALDIFRLPRREDVKLEKIDLKPTIEEIIRFAEEFLLKEAARKWGFPPEKVCFEFEAQGRDFTLKAYRPVLEFLLLVPLDNACGALRADLLKEDPSRGVIKVHLREEKDFLVYEVMDRGVGMEKEKLERVRAALAEAVRRKEMGVDILRGYEIRSQEGGRRLGLGLMLSAYYLSLFEGRGGTGEIEIDSQPREGTRVRFMFPKNPGQETFVF